MIETEKKQNTITGDTTMSASKQALHTELDKLENDVKHLQEASEAILRCSDFTYSKVAKYKAELDDEKGLANQRIGYITEELKTKQAPDYSYLSEVEKYSGGKEVAKNIRKVLKKEFKYIKFSVTSDYSSVRVSWEGGVTQTQVDAHISKFQSGHFDGMQDMYVNSSSEFNDTYGGVDYVFLNRDVSHEVSETVKQAIEVGATRELEQYESDRLAREATWNTDFTGKGEISGVHFDYDLQRYVVDFTPLTGAHYA